MSDDLPVPPPPPKGSDLPPPPPPELIEKNIISDELEDSFEDIKNSIDNILSEVSEISPPGLDIQPPPLPPGQDIQEISQSSEVISHESISETLESEEKSLSDKLAVFDLSENEDISKDTEQVSHDDETSNSASINHLRPSTEVDSIPGDKLHAILSENEISLVNPDGSPIKQTIDGELIIKNPSKKHRAWDIEVELSNTASTDLGGKIVTVRELEATEVTTIPYSSNGPRMINIRETIDTESEREQEASLSLVFSDNPQEVLIMIEIENISNVSLTNVSLTRNFPSNFQIPNSPEYSIEENTVIWEIGRMSVGENRKLSILANVLINSVEKIPAGSSEVNYKAESTVSRISFENVSSSGRQFSYVNAIEDDRPGVWHCKCVFENKSSFVVSLSGASVRLVGRESPILDLSDLRQDIPPEGSWESMEKRVESDDQPSFTQEVRYSILPRVSVQSSGSITTSEQNLSVLDAQILKRFDI